MTIKQAIEILDTHNKWRRDDEGAYTMADPKELGKAIDKIIEFSRKQLIKNKTR